MHCACCLVQPTQFSLSPHAYFCYAVTSVVLKYNHFLSSQQDVFCALISLDGNHVACQENPLGRWQISVEHKSSLYFNIKGEKANQPNKQKTYPVSIL